MKNKTLYETSEKLKKYYDDIVEIEKLNHRIEHLVECRNKIKQKISNSDVILYDDTSAINYDSVKVQSNICLSVQERSLDKAFNDLDKQVKNLNSEILQTELQISIINKNNSDIEFIISKLNDESKKIIKLLYKEKRNCMNIGKILNMDESTVRKKKHCILTDISKWICCLF